MAARYRSAGWKKDLEHALKVYYRHNVTSFIGAEWAKVKEKFFILILPHKEEMLGIKEGHPMEYMPYMEEHFWGAMSLQLNRLQNFTGWIKPGSYYHGLVARQGHLYKCPHLVGTPLPRWPQLMPSKSCLVSQKKPETPATSSGAPAMEASAPQGATTDKPAPMETGGAGTATPGHTELRTKMILKGVGQQNAHGHSQGDMKTSTPTPSHSRMRREGMPSPRRSTGIQGNSHWLIIM